MGFIEYAAVICILCFGRALGVCVLTRNEHNKYPFVLKLAANGVFRCHGALITPRRFIAAYQPVKEFVDDPTLLPTVFVTGTVYGPYGVGCIVAGRLKKATRIPYGQPNPKLFVGELDAALRVRNEPFLYPKVAAYDVSLFEKRFAEMPDFGCCVLPVYGRNTSNAPMLEDSVMYVKGETADYWRNVFCKNSSVCDELTRRNNFFAYQTRDISDDPFWYQGTVIICDGLPLGSMTMLIKDSESTKVAMFEHIKLHASYLKTIFSGDWKNAAARCRYSVGSVAAIWLITVKTLRF